MYHGVSDKFKPILKGFDDYSKVGEMRTRLGLDDKDFTLFYNNRNIRRKNW